MYDNVHCMRASCRPVFYTNDSGEEPLAPETWRLLKPKAKSAFGFTPSHWTEPLDFLGNLLWFCPTCRHRINSSRSINVDPHRLEDKLEDFFEKYFFNCHDDLVTVEKVLTGPDDQGADDGSLQMDKFHLLEMLAFLKAWNGRGV